MRLRHFQSRLHYGQIFTLLFAMVFGPTSTAAAINEQEVFPYRQMLLRCLESNAPNAGPQRIPGMFILLEACVGIAEQSCRLTDNDYMPWECIDVESLAWKLLYEQSLEVLREDLITHGNVDGLEGLEESVRANATSLRRDCPYEVLSWPENATMRRDSSFLCERDAQAERAVKFFLWNWYPTGDR